MTPDTVTFPAVGHHSSLTGIIYTASESNHMCITNLPKCPFTSDSAARHGIWYGTKGVDLTGLLGDIKEDWRSGGQSPRPPTGAFLNYT